MERGRFMLKGKHLLEPMDFTLEETAEIFETAEDIIKELETKKKFKVGDKYGKYTIISPHIKIHNTHIVVKVKCGDGGRIFGTVSTKEIAAAAKQQLGYDLDKKKMQLPNAIKCLGTTMVPIKLHPKVTSELKVIVREA